MQTLINLIESGNNIFWELNILLKGLYPVTDYNKKAYLYYANPKSNLLLQAHIDTARIEKGTPKVIQEDNILRAKNSILGADDRAGCYAIIRAVTQAKEKGLTLPNILFTDDEEIGGRGMEEFLLTHKTKRFKHIDLAIALDRQGVGEFVTYVNNPVEVNLYIERHGFHKKTGSYSDIRDFSTKTKIPSVNLSVGYYYEHTKSEYLCIDELELTISRLMKIIENPIKERYPCEQRRPKYESYSGYGKDWRGHGHYDFDNKIYDNDKTMLECDYCGSYASLTKISDHGVNAMICQTCIAYVMDEQPRDGYPIGS
jgi:hypothetical protein